VKQIITQTRYLRQCIVLMQSVYLQWWSWL